MYYVTHYSIVMNNFRHNSGIFIIIFLVKVSESTRDVAVEVQRQCFRECPNGCIGCQEYIESNLDSSFKLALLSGLSIISLRPIGDHR